MRDDFEIISHIFFKIILSEVLLLEHFVRLGKSYFVRKQRY